MTFDKRKIKPILTHYDDDGATELLTDHCFGFQTTVTTQSLSGAFAINVIPSATAGITQRSADNIIPYLLRRVAPRDIISIQFTSAEPYFMGIVENIGFNKVRGDNGKYSRALTIKGRNGGKLVEEMTLAIDDMVVEQLKESIERAKDAFPDREWSNGMIEKLTEFMKASGSWAGAISDKTYFEALSILLDAAGIFSYPVKWAVGSGDRNEWKDFILLDKKWIKQFPGEIINTNEAITAHSLAQSISALYDPNFYEAWIDTRIVDGKPYWVIRLRPKPFDRLDDYLPLYPPDREPSSMADIELKTIEEWERHDPGCFGDYADLTWDRTRTFINNELYWTLDGFETHDYSVSDRDMYSVYRSDYVTPVHVPFALAQPFIDIMAFMKHGYKQLNVTHKTHIDREAWDPDMLFGNKVDEAKMKRMEVWSNIEHKIASMRLFNWNGMNNLMGIGYAEGHPDDRIRAGDKCFFPTMPPLCGDSNSGLYAYGHSVSQSWNRVQGGKTRIDFHRAHNDSIRDLWLSTRSVDDIRLQMQKTIWNAYNV